MILFYNSLNYLNLDIDLSQFKVKNKEKNVIGLILDLYLI